MTDNKAIAAANKDTVYPNMGNSGAFQCQLKLLVFDIRYIGKGKCYCFLIPAVSGHLIGICEKTGLGFGMGCAFFCLGDSGRKLNCIGKILKLVMGVKPLFLFVKTKIPDSMERNLYAHRIKNSFQKNDYCNYNKKNIVLLLPKGI